jgi:hypothetical protein
LNNPTTPDDIAGPGRHADLKIMGSMGELGFAHEHHAMLIGRDDPSPLINVTNERTQYTTSLANRTKRPDAWQWLSVNMLPDIVERLSSASLFKLRQERAGCGTITLLLFKLHRSEPFPRCSLHVRSHGA